MGTSRETLSLAAQSERSSLADSDLFQTAVKYLPDKNHGYLYVDLQQGLRLLERSIGDDVWNNYVENGEPYLTSLRAIAMATEPLNRGGEQHGVLFFVTDY
jgi:hypothetical protein